jgi:3-oxoadipate enol-lactonase
MTSGCASFEFDGLAGRIRASGGPRVLWLHGYTLDAGSWEELWDRLPRYHHVGVDLPGHGGSRPLAAGEDLQALGRRLQRLSVEHGARHLVAVSYGTIAAIQVAVERPDWFSSIVLGAPAVAGGPRDPGMERSYMRLFQLSRQSRPQAELIRAWMESPAWEGVNRRPALKERLEPIVSRHAWHELRDLPSSLRMTMPFQTDELLRPLRSAVLVVLGEHEMPAYRETAEFLRRTLPACQVAELAGAGHLCLLEAPAASAALIDRHLAVHAAA